MTFPDFIVGIGASAGGLQAFKDLVPGLPADRNIAYVLLQHMDPSHDGSLADLLAPHCSVPVSAAADGMALAGNTLYLCPPGKCCVLSENTIRVRETGEEVPRHTIDYLFTSLAEQYPERCAGIILSGAGNDGLQGIQEIKAAGGWALVQDPETAKFTSMPKSVINHYLADFIRPAGDLGREVAELARLIPPSLQEDSLPDDSEKLQQLLEVLEKGTGFNFQRYKESMLLRRINRRMAVNKVSSLGAYLALVKKSREEAHCLVKDMFVSVTGFFRDPKVFERLEEVLRSIVREKPGGEVRIWSAGCATGEEALSIALFLAQLKEELKVNPEIKIFATDLDAGNIDRARKGLYSSKAVEHVPASILNKHFEQLEDGYCVKGELRETVIFAMHDITTDAPFSRLDLVCCRNLLIYFNRQTQSRLLTRFHYALRPGGFLLLGTSENTGKTDNLFQSLDRQINLYQRLEVKTPAPQAFAPEQALGTGANGVPPQPGFEPARPTMQQEIRDLYFNAFAPAAVLLNHRFELEHIHGNVQPYLRLGQGDVKLSITHMAHPRLQTDMRLVLQQARHKGQTCKSRPIKLPDGDERETDGNGTETTLLAVPKQSAEGRDNEPGKILLVFEERPCPADDTGGEDNNAGDNRRVRELEEELTATREQLQANIEALESTNQELQSLNEEYQSTTEELQTANEEFQTTNEELESANEELISVNEELRSKSDELARANMELDYILNATLSGMIVLDDKLSITRYSESCKQLFKLWPREVNNIQQLMARLGGLTAITPHIENSLATGDSHQLELELEEKYFLIRLIPVKAREGDTVHGLIVAFYDETQQREREQESKLLAAIVRESDDAIFVHDLNGTIQTWNQGAERLFGYSENEATGMSLTGLMPQDEYHRYMRYIERLVKGTTDAGLETKILRRDGTALVIWSKASTLTDQEGRTSAVAVIQRDITQIRATEKRLNALVESTPDPIIIIRADGAIERINKQAESLFGYSRKELLGMHYKQLVPERFRDQHDVYTREYLKKPTMRQMGKGLDLWCQTKSGEEIPVDIGLSPVIVGEETTTLVRFRDVREEREKEKILRRAKQDSDEANRTKSRFLAAASHDLRQPLQSISMYLGVLAGDLSPVEKTKVLGQARMSLDTTNKLLNSLLNITKLEAGRVQPEITDFNIQDLLERVGNTEANQAAEKSQKFSVMPANRMVHSDPALLEQLVTNLVANAVKYTPEHGHVVLGCRRQQDSLNIMVCDNGPGIASHELDLIFDEYRQLEYNGHYLGKGLGLGLSIVKLISELLDLKLIVRSIPGRGSSFGVLVPLAENRDKPAARHAGVDTAAGGQKDASHSTLLFVEDDTAVLDSTTLFLELSGFTVVTARNSTEALAALADRPPDLIISDYGLGQDEQSGIELVKQLRKQAGGNLPAILITGDTTERRAQEARGENCEIVCKPIEPQTLIHAIGKQLAGRH